jgi:hypothetical protein
MDLAKAFKQGFAAKSSARWRYRMRNALVVGVRN